VYVPEGAGPFPALVMAPGHGAGKSSNFGYAAAFADAGVLVLSIDPLGQGERLQHFDPELGGGTLDPGGPTRGTEVRRWEDDGLRLTAFAVEVEAGLTLEAGAAACDRQRSDPRRARNREGSA